MKNFQKNPFNLDENPMLSLDSSRWSPLRQEPAKVIPQRVVRLSVFITGAAILLALFFKQPVLKVAAGYWLGVGVNLINFHWIVKGTKNYLDKAEQGIKTSTMGGFLLRQVLAGSAIFIAIILGASAMLMAFIGLSMVKIVVQADSLFNLRGTKY